MRFIGKFIKESIVGDLIILFLAPINKSKQKINLLNMTITKIIVTNNWSKKKHIYSEKMFVPISKERLISGLTRLKT